ncbi:MAG: hypothetical protein U0441_31960 [Polyangiaceae bacterium]
MAARPLQHLDAEKKDDETLRAEARAHLAESPSLQLVAEVLAKLRAVDLPFWSPEVLRERWSAAERMRWLRQRPDLRQAITTSLTGLAPKAARKKMPDFQAALVDSVVDEGDVPVRAFEASFEPVDLAVYGPASGYWFAMRELFPWSDDRPAHQELVAWLLKALLTDTSSISGLGRVPILTAWDLRTAIDGRVWHTRIPIEIRVAIDDARMSLERDRPGAPFHAQDDLAIAVPEIIAASVPLKDLLGVLTAAERAMGFDKETPRPRGGPPDLKPPASTAQGKSIAPPPAAPAEAPVAAAAPPPVAAAASAPPPAAAASAPPPAAAASAPPSAAAAAVTASAIVSAVAPPAFVTEPAVAIAPEPRRPHTPGVPTLEDELERTNPWVVPTAEELAAAVESAADSESAPSKRRRR